MLHVASPLRTSLLYALLAALWIIGSDELLVRLLGERGLGAVSPLKGTIFVVLTAPMLYLVLRRREGRLRDERERRRGAEERYSRIFSRSFAPMLVLDGVSGRVVDANPAAMDFYGWPREELLVRHLHDLSLEPPEALDEAFVSAVNEVRTSFACQHRTASGAIRDVEVVTSVIGGTDHPMLVSIVHDVTERTAAEQSLRASEARYRGLLERGSDPIIILSAGLVVLEANERARQMLRYDADALRGLHASALVTEGQLQRQPVRFKELAEGKTLITERVLRRSDGVEVQVEMSSRRLPEGDYELILRDVTERRAHEEQRRQTQKLEALGQLAGGIAHDLNNVLTVVLANAALVRSSLLEEEGDPVADLAQLETSAQRGVVMVRKLLSFGRAAPLAIRPTDVATVVHELEPTLRRLLPAHISIICHVAAGGAVALADAGALEQVLINLATNARDAMPKGGTLEIAVHAAAGAEGDVVLSVQDDGVGIEAATRDRIFEPFFTTKPVGAGTGLGLTVVYGLVQQQGGTISLETAPGHGTRFRIGLPAAPADAVASVHEAPDAPAAWPHGTETILLVEDEPALRSSASRILARLGYTVITAEDGQAGLEAFERERARVELVLSDVVMPRMGGRAMFEAVRAQDASLRFLFMSGYGAADLQDLHEAAGGAAPVLPKPWTAGDLARAVRAVLDAV